MEYKDRLKAARVNRGYSQGHLAHLSGLQQPKISRLEHGLDPDDETKEKLSAILPELIGGEAPAGVSQMLSMKLNNEAQEAKENEKEEEERKMGVWLGKAIDAFNAPKAPYGTFENVPKDVTLIKALPKMETSVSELARAIFERDVYKSLYENLLEKVMSK